MSVFIGGAWPYANGSLHLGHVTSLLPGDILARYFRLKGEDVLYVSGSDCNGTPISVKADQEGVSSKEIADRYHREFVDCFEKLGFSYDLYTRTDDSFHHDVVQEIFMQLLDNGHLEKKAVKQTFCDDCNRFLPDRYVEGMCPNCGKDARGDQCDHCSALLDPIDLHDKKCKLCGEAPSIKETKHYYFKLDQFQTRLEEYLEAAKKSGYWRENAVHLTERYLKEGLRERAATRDLPIGVKVPVEGFEEKKIYVWIEAVSGYLSASKQWAEYSGGDWKPFWGQNTEAYYTHGKDNIPFHSIIWPAILMGTGNLHLPDHIISGEYLTIEQKKLSTSKNWAVWLPDMLERYHPDSIRYFLTVNAPENRDADFSWREFIYSHNSELLGAFGNLVNRTLKFIEKSFDCRVPSGNINGAVKQELEQLYTSTARNIERGKNKRALEELFAFVRSANKYFDEEQPWIQVQENKPRCADTLFTCVQIIANLSNLLEPFLPFSCEKIRQFLHLYNAKWDYVELVREQPIESPKILFERLDPKIIDEEVERLQSRSI